MDFLQRFPCYVCMTVYDVRRMSRIDREDDVHKREIAITRRYERGHIDLEVSPETRLCVNCNVAILNEIDIIEQDPACIRLNIIRQRSHQRCCVCNGRVDLARISLAARVTIFIKQNIYVPEGVRCCDHHLDEERFMLNILLPGLESVNCPCLLKGKTLQAFLQGFRSLANKRSQDFCDENSYSDNEFKIMTSVSKIQFQELFGYCDPVPIEGGFRYLLKKDLLLFLCKLKQGVSDEFLKIIFGYNTRQSVSLAITKVRLSLMTRFVRDNIGFHAITHHQYIERHVTPFSNELYNPRPENPKAICLVDATYAYIDRSSNFRTLRQTFSQHKGRHLVKPTLLVAPDGYILAVLSVYFTDGRNTDSMILENEFENDVQGMRNWFMEGDILLVDRGYRDAIPLLNRVGINYKMPAFIQPGERQLSTEAANNSRLVTKSRWVIESRNGHFKLIFKFFDQVINMQHVQHLKDFYLIAGAIINRYHPPILMANATVDLARTMLARAREINLVQQRVEEERLFNRRGLWQQLNNEHVPQFPHLSMDYLRNLTFGTYQIKLSASYVQDRIFRDDHESFEIDQRLNEPGFVRLRVYSRFRRREKYQVFIQYTMQGNHPDEMDEENVLITGYYCSCKTGARTLGTCAHICSILWYLGLARHNENVKYPSASLLQHIKDAANRPVQDAMPHQL